MTDDDARQKIAKTQVAADAVGNEFELARWWEFEKAAFCLLKVMLEHLEKQLILELEDGPQGDILEMSRTVLRVFFYVCFNEGT